jgi:hypothetical protein
MESESHGLNQFREVIAQKLNQWQQGDLRPAVLYVRPTAQQMLDIHLSWNDQRITICPVHLKASRFLKANSQNSIDAVIQGLQAIAANSCFGKVSITPRRGANSIKGQIYFKVVWTVSFHTKVAA